MTNSNLDLIMRSLSHHHIDLSRNLLAQRDVRNPGRRRVRYGAVRVVLDRVGGVRSVASALDFEEL